LVRGHFPGHDKTKRLAERIAPLAGITVEKNQEFVVSENWREALRLCIASCNDDDVDEAIEAILTPLATEDAEKIARPRAVLAVLCLADEPNVSDAIGKQVLQQFARQVGENDARTEKAETSLDTAAMELTHSVWARKLQEELIKEFCQREVQTCWNPGGLCSMMSEEIIFALSDSSSEIEKLIEQLDCANGRDIIMNSLTLMNIAYSKHFPTELVSIALDKLSFLLNQSDAMAHAIAWAMGWLAIRHQEQATEWAKNDANIQSILAYLKQSNFDKKASYWLVVFVGQVKDLPAVEPLIAKLVDESEHVRSAACYALGKIKDVRAVEPLIARLDDEDKDVRSAACYALGEIKDVRAVEPLIAKLDDEDKGVRSAAYDALGKIKDVQADKYDGMEYDAHRMLGEIKGVRAVELLIAKLNDENAKVRSAACYMLGEIKDVRAVEPLVAKLDDENAEVKSVAYGALGEIKNARIIVTYCK